MGKEKTVMLPFKHISTRLGERKFRGTITDESADFKLVKPDRVFFIQTIKFAPGRGFQDYIDHYNAVDDALKARYGKTRCQMDCHEIATFVTLGTHDMVVIWDSPDLETLHRVVTTSASQNRSFGNCETHPVLNNFMH